MCSVISLTDKQKQDAKDRRKLARVRELIDEHHKVLSDLYESEREIVNRLGLNKPDHDPEAA